MDLVGAADWVERISSISSILEAVWSALQSLWRWLFELPTKYPQLLNALFGLAGWVLAVWKYWEGREVNLFRKFERMIEGLEAQLVKARTDVLDVMTRPGPGLLIQPPIFAEKPLRDVLARHKWHSAFSKLKHAQSIDRRLEKAVVTCDRKVKAHTDRLALFRQQVASARLIQGALAAGRAAKTQEEHAQRLDQEALDHFRAVLGIPGHEDDLGALELIAHQLARLDPRSQSALNAYHAVIRRLQAQPAAPNRNRVLARVKRCLAILRYPTAHGIAQGYLTEAIQLLTQFGPPRDRDFLELAQAFHMDGIARLKIGHNVQAPLQLEFAQGHYRDLIRSLHKRRRGLFRWMLRERRFSGHRVGELEARAKEGLANVNHLIKLNNRHPDLLIASLKKGRGVPRHNRRPPR